MSVVINGSAGVTTNSGAVYNGISAGTAVASTSGTSIDFTSIPSWVKRITVMFSGVSTNGTSNLQVQIGDSGGIETTSYVAGAGYATTMLGSSAAFIGSAFRDSASETYQGSMIITLMDTSNTWSSVGNLTTSAPRVHVSAGVKALSGTLDRVRITTVNGTDTFDAGSINILYE